jgi:radical SAM protein with 4Fe4S-binding SPASM domain
MGDYFAGLFEKGIEGCEPSQVKIELNHNCNLKCIHCYIDQANTAQLSLKRLCGLFDELLELNGLMLALTGGEPLIHPDFKKIVREAAGRGFILELLTNGILIDEALAGLLRRSRVSKVQISLYGHTPEVHEAITRSKGSFRKTLRGIKLLRDAGVKVSLACSLTKQNFRHWRAIRDMAEKQLGQSIKISYWIMDSDANAGHIEDVRMSVEEVEQYLSDLYQTIEFRMPAKATAEDLDERICLAGINNCRILPNGDVIPCSRINRVMGNIYASDFGTIWEKTPFLKELRRLRRRDLKLCTDCEDFSICLICPGFSYGNTKDFTSPDQSVCAYTHADGNIRRRLSHNH